MAALPALLPPLNVVPAPMPRELLFTIIAEPAELWSPNIVPLPEALSLFVMEANPAVLLLANAVTPVSLLMMFAPVGMTLGETAVLEAVALFRNSSWPSVDTVNVGAGEAGSRTIPVPPMARVVLGRAKLKLDAPAVN